MRIGILTSGGDCPGINATIRGVCKTAINYYGMEVVGIHSGFQGLLTKDVESITDKSLSGLLNLGGTMLGTSREKPFKKGGVVSDVDKPSLILQNIREMELHVPLKSIILRKPDVCAHDVHKKTNNNKRVPANRLRITLFIIYDLMSLIYLFTKIGRRTNHNDKSRTKKQ